MRYIKYFVIVLCILPSIVQGQHEPFKKGSIMAFWGWNRSGYTKSDIRFSGNGYDFTLNNVVAHDRPTKFS